MDEIKSVEECSEARCDCTSLRGPILEGCMRCVDDKVNQERKHRAYDDVAQFACPRMRKHQAAQTSDDAHHRAHAPDCSRFQERDDREEGDRGAEEPDREVESNGLADQKHYSTPNRSSECFRNNCPGSDHNQRNWEEEVIPEFIGEAPQ